jgi:two-component system sensor histidine kinase KdpD
VGEVVDTALKRLRRRLAGHRVVRELSSDLPFAKADPLLLEQALVNLLDNAAKYAPPDSTITIHAQVDSQKIAVTVADEGPGVPAAELSHIFDKFYRARKGDLGAAGTGLGLSVARGFVEAFGGTLNAANREGSGGAVFTLTMPVGEKPEEGDHGK